MDFLVVMVKEVCCCIWAEQGDIFVFDVDGKQWDIVFIGLNVFYYLLSCYLQEVIEKIVVFVKFGGYFLGDFIMFDYICWYFNVMYVEDQLIVFLCIFRFIEEEGWIYQESEIFNIEFWDG